MVMVIFLLDLLSMQLKLGLDKLFSYMDLEELAKHMSMTPYATSCVVREKLSFVWLLQALPRFSLLVARLPIQHSKFPLKSMNPQPVPFPEILTWPS